jgi:hypothetical protein
MEYVVSNIQHEDQTVPKIIIGGIHKPIVYYDKLGEFGIFTKGQRHYFVGDSLGKINSFFQTKLSTLLLKYIKFEQDFIRPNFYPDLRDFKGEINDTVLAKYYEFTNDEVNVINRMESPVHLSKKDIKLRACMKSHSKFKKTMKKKRTI